MLSIIQKRFALSRQGAIDFLKGVLATGVLNIFLMFPAVYFYVFFADYIRLVFNSSAISQNGVLYYSLCSLVFMIIMFFVCVFQYRNTFSSVYRESATRRISLAEKLRQLPLSFFGEKNLSDLSSSIMEDGTELEHTFSHAVPQLFASVLSLGLIAIGLFVYNWCLALALFWVAPIALLVLLLSKKMQNKGNELIYDKKRDVSEKINEGLENIQEIKSYSREDAYVDELNTIVDKHEKQLINSELLSGALVYLSQSILQLGLVSVIIVGIYLLTKGEVDLFTYLIFLLVSSSIYNPIGDVFNNIAALFYLDVRINRMNEIQNLESQEGDTCFKPNKFDIRFENVSFSYHDNKKVIDNVSFVAKQGEVTALVGPSGGGKSTIAKLAARFWDVDSGVISLNNRDISTVDPEVLLENFSVVFQDVLLFNSSIMDNIRIGNMNASENEIIQAAKMAQCDNFINCLPEGYNTIIGENGSNLSGGERQRISIARALLKNAPIVLLDEATASLDVENETKIQIAISELVRKKTVIIIAHRMRTIANADKVIVLEEGKIIETGSPDVLKKNNGAFANMLDIQTSV